MAAFTLLAAGCDDEVTNGPDGGTSKDGGSADVAAPGDGGNTNGDGGITNGDGGNTNGDGSTGDGAVTGDGSTTAALTPQQAHGQYLVDHVVACPDCHTPRDAMGAPIPGKYLSGAKCFVQLPNGHCLHTRNLTNDPTGLKNRTPEEIKNMFLNGIRPPATSGGSTDAGATQTALNPVMPYYVFHNMDSGDADDIVAYLRTVPAVVNELPPRDVEFDVMQPAPYLDPAIIPLPRPDALNQESAMHGRYLASKIGLCVECHTQHNTPGPGPVLMTAKLFQGGEMFPFPQFPVVPTSKNLTSDVATGLGTWTADQIVTVLKLGKDKDGKGICPPMPVGPMGAYGGLSNEDARDIANYIKSLPAATNMVVDMCSFPFPPPPDGAAPGDAGASPDAPGTDGGADDAAAGG